ncbi:PAS domain-containing protein [Fulvivirga ligni]|uniref:PAS domain-containing protein n=1 Tax=Fulvivirga ligni TaxID=2904246 RepID=UPI001F45877E|nr:PAS domain-containing protein [Fulvivirga ligni]UII23099.1 PAS domain-containing protein [Fulvivirga ligni]
MNLDLKNLSIGKQILFLCFAFFLLALTNFFLIDHYQKNLLEDTERINALRKLQTLTEEFQRESSAYINGEAAKLRLESTRSEINGIVNKIGNNPDSEISIVTDSTNLSEFSSEELESEIYALWQSTSLHIEDLLYEPLKIDSLVEETRQVPLNDSLNTYTTETSQKVLVLNNAKVIRANNHIQEDILKINKLSHALSTKQIEAKKEDHSYLTFILFVFLLLFTAAIIFVYTFIKKQVVEPLDKLSKSTEDVSNGKLDITSIDQAPLEIIKITNAVNKIVTNLKSATSFVKSIEEGQLNAQLESISEENVGDESLEKALLLMREQMKKVEIADQERKWTTEGLAKFVDILRSTDDSVSKLGDIIISNLVKYTHSNQGGIYIIDEEDSQNIKLELVSLFAFDSKKYDTKSYRIGEGLVGQTYQEKETIYLLEVPDEYVSITSGLGNANPKSLLLVPLKINNEIYGVIELASFTEYKQYEIEFVEKLGESIASTIAGVKNNQRTKHLLEESQELAEQMQGQEEEMRQNMEELQATQEQLQRQMNDNNKMQEDLIKEKALLDALMNSLPDYIYFKDLESKFIRISKSMEKLFPFSVDEMIGKSDFDFHAHEAASKFFNEEQEIIKSGQGFVNNLVHELVANGTDQWVLTTKLPFFDKAGNCMGTFGTSKDITDVKNDLVGEGEGNIDEVEAMLRQHLEELQITQEQLDKKLQTAETSLKAFEEIANIIIIDNEEKISYINANALNFLEVEKSELIHKETDTLIDKTVLTQTEWNTFVTKEVSFKTNHATKQVNIYADQSNHHIHIIWF